MTFPLRGWLMMSAPYAAVLLGLYIFKHAFVSLLIYHVLIVAWAFSGGQHPRPLPLFRGWFSFGGLASVGAAVVVVPVLWLLMPIMLQPGIVMLEWLNDYGLSGVTLWGFVFYFGLVHPVLEEIHWGLIRQRMHSAWYVHMAFACYHVLVLALLLSRPWALLAGVVLAGTSFCWGYAERKAEGSLVPVLSHTLADFAIVVTTVLMAVRGEV